jgi:hypothetical protein
MVAVEGIEIVDVVETIHEFLEAVGDTKNIGVSLRRKKVRMSDKPRILALLAILHLLGREIIVID